MHSEPKTVKLLVELSPEARKRMRLAAALRAMKLQVLAGRAIQRYSDEVLADAHISFEDKA
jgi:hypothetical protein